MAAIRRRLKIFRLLPSLYNHRVTERSLSMDEPRAALIAIAIFALLVIFLALRFRNRIKGGIKGPLGTEVTFEASNPQRPMAPGVRVEGARSHAGGLLAMDGTGRGADVKDVETYGDIRVTSEPNPKAEPPA